MKFKIFEKEKTTMFKLRKSWAAIAASVAVLGLLLTAAAPRAAADSCGAGCYDLNYQNGNLPVLGSYGTVQVTQVDANTVTITFTAAEGLGIDNIAGYMGSLTGDTLSYSGTFAVGTPGPLTTGGSHQLDGFGSFSNSVDVNGSGSASSYSQIVITITNDNGVSASTFETANDDSVTFAVSLAPYNGNTQGYNTTCTGFVGDQPGKTTQPPASNNCGSPVPEPGSLMLMGTGLIGLAGALRRRLRRA